MSDGRPRWRVQAFRRDEAGRDWVHWRDYTDSLAALAAWREDYGDADQVDLVQDGRVVRTRTLEAGGWQEEREEAASP